jgi:hypothetical protein
MLFSFGTVIADTEELVLLLGGIFDCYYITQNQTIILPFRIQGKTNYLLTS